MNRSVYKESEKFCAFHFLPGRNEVGFFREIHVFGEDVSKRTHLRRNYRNKSRR